MKIILFLPYVSRALWFSPLFLSPFPCSPVSPAFHLHFPQQHPFPVGFITTPTSTPSVAEISSEVNSRLHSQGISPTDSMALPGIKANAAMPGGAQRRGHSSPAQPSQAGEATASHLLEQVPLLKAELLRAAVQQPGWQPVGPCCGRLAMQQWAGC